MVLPSGRTGLLVTKKRLSSISSSLTITVSKPLTLRMYVTYPNNKAYSDVVLIQVYSNGMSEVYLGRAIKKFNLPRDELVIMTKVYCIPCLWSTGGYSRLYDTRQGLLPISKEYCKQHMDPGSRLHRFGQPTRLEPKGM